MQEGRVHTSVETLKGKRERIIKSKERVKKHGEVFTPEKIVKQMCDMLEENEPDAFQPEKTYLEPACGTGNFLVEILRRKLDHCQSQDYCITALRSIYGIDILPDNVEESKRRMLEVFLSRWGDADKREAESILKTNIVCANFLDVAEDIRLCKGNWFAERTGGGM